MIIGKKLDIQKTIDGYIDKVFLWAIPHSVRPNHVTVIRFILVPIIYLLLRSGMFDVGLAVFVVAACTDFIDGAMARTRGQITDVGKVIDPIADKFLIMSVLLYIGFSYWIVRIFVIVIIFELIAVLMGAFFSFAVGRPMGANFFGKIKMILQSFSVGLFILGILIKNFILINISEYILFGALVFAIAAGVEHLRLKLMDYRKLKKSL
jgi:CDP-diacylglycerol--glycerol-3-phosphate 3-phosphatidyltransferase